MVRVMRYPRFFACSCALTIACALGRDVCAGAGMTGRANVLLVLTLALLALSVVLMSCRFFVDACGVGVGSLLRVRRTDWAEIAALGLLCCNGRRRYLYGMYAGRTDFINLIHRAPHCGPWGFVVPLSGNLVRALCRYCPFPVDLSGADTVKREGKIRWQGQQAALHLLIMLPCAAIAFMTGAAMLLQAAETRAVLHMTALTLLALGLLFAGAALLYRALLTLNTCPGFSEEGVCAGLNLYIPWDQVRFCYVHRSARMSGLFLLSCPQAALNARGAPPVRCLSMPDTATMLLAYLNYCPHAEKGERI